MRGLTLRISVVCLAVVMMAITPGRPDVASQVVLRTGDVVPGFGAIGNDSFGINGIEGCSCAMTASSRCRC